MTSPKTMATALGEKVGYLGSDPLRDFFRTDAGRTGSRFAAVRAAVGIDVPRTEWRTVETTPAGIAMRSDFRAWATAIVADTNQFPSDEQVIDWIADWTGV